MIPPNADLVFEITLVSLTKNVKIEVTREVKNEATREVEIEVTKNVTCTSDQKTRDKDTVKFNYIGKLENGIFHFIFLLDIIVDNKSYVYYKK